MCVCGFIFKAVSVGIGYERYEILFTVQKYILTLCVCVYKCACESEKVFKGFFMRSMAAFYSFSFPHE